MRTEETIALVTGASRGIGRAVARRLAADGHTVVVHYGRDEQAAARTVRDIEDAGGRALPVRAVLGHDGDADELVDRAEDALRTAGLPSRLDVLVSNAAITGTATLDTMTAAEFDRVMAVNARAPLLVVRRALPLLRDGARIVVVSSMVTRTAPPEIAYVMSKGALDAMTRTLAQVLGPRGITVNAVAPGLTDTDLMAAAIDVPGVRERAGAATALGRVGEPEDVAEAVGLLASDRARWITGQVVDAGGGLFLRPPL